MLFPNLHTLSIIVLMDMISLTAIIMLVTIIVKTVNVILRPERNREKASVPHVPRSTDSRKGIANRGKEEKGIRNGPFFFCFKLIFLSKRSAAIYARL